MAGRRQEEARVRADWPLRAQSYELALTPSSPMRCGEVVTDVGPRHADSPVVHFHPGFEVGMVLEGRLNVDFEDTSMSLRRGEVWLCGAWEIHGAWLPRGRTTWFAVVFLPQFLGDERFGSISWEELFAAPAKERPRVTTPEMRQAALALAREMRREIESKPPAWQDAIRLCLLRLLLLLSRSWSPATDVRQSPLFYAEDIRRIMPALTLAHSDPARLIRVSEAAQACGFSEGRFRSLFRRCTGMTFSDFRLRHRLVCVTRRLLTTVEPLEAIARQSGFADASHLHHTFVRRYGCTPGQYRGLHKADNRVDVTQ